MSVFVRARWARRLAIKRGTDRRRWLQGSSAAERVYGSALIAASGFRWHPTLDGLGTLVGRELWATAELDAIGHCALAAFAGLLAQIALVEFGKCVRQRSLRSVALHAATYCGKWR